MPCCHIPAPENPAFPGSLIPDAELFAKYVGGATMQELGNQQPTSILTSALHLEIKLWRVNRGLPRNRYTINAQFHNSWRAMLAVWLSPVNGDTFTENEKAQILQELSSLKCPQKSQTCVLSIFDRWMLDKMIQLRENGRDPIRQPILPGVGDKVTALASFGLAQKLINIFLKYEICWQVAGQWVNGDWVPYNDPALRHLPRYMCALHAPLDRILLDALKQFELGRWLKRTSLLRSADSTLRQSSDGHFRPWSKLDCLRTYYGLQLMLRKIAMNTWPHGCACAPSSQEAIQACADWFNNNYGAAHPCGQDQPDWIQAACDLPEVVILTTVNQLINSPEDEPLALTSANKMTNQTQIPAPETNPTLNERPQAQGACAKCLLGRHVIQAHLDALQRGEPLPNPSPNFVVQHNNHHRIVVCSENGWAFQYHINNKWIRIDRFSEGNQTAPTARYTQFCAARAVQNNNFGNGIEGNGTRSIHKSTDQGASENPQQFPMIAQQAVTAMSHIFNL
jgi:hypothetical protein